MNRFPFSDNFDKSMSSLELDPFSLHTFLLPGGVAGKSTTVGADLKPEESGGGRVLCFGGLFKWLASNPVGKSMFITSGTIGAVERSTESAFGVPSR